MFPPHVTPSSPIVVPPYDAAASMFQYGYNGVYSMYIDMGTVKEKAKNNDEGDDKNRNYCRRCKRYETLQQYCARIHALVTNV